VFPGKGQKLGTSNISKDTEFSDLQQKMEEGEIGQ
jgi:hypothetical protein